jgi:hypothetical protein
MRDAIDSSRVAGDARCSNFLWGGGHAGQTQEDGHDLRETKSQSPIPPAGGDRTKDRTLEKRLPTGPQFPQRADRGRHQPAAGRRSLEPEPLDEAGSFGDCFSPAKIRPK